MKPDKVYINYDNESRYKLNHIYLEQYQLEEKMKKL